MDFILAIAVIWGLGLRPSFLAKKSLFLFPLGPIMKSLGGLAVDRSAPQGLVEQMNAQFNSRTQLVLGITPEGTRGSVGEWKQGFARIAHAAQVPVLPGILNYSTRTVQFDRLITELDNVGDIVAATRRSASNGHPKRDLTG